MGRDLGRPTGAEQKTAALSHEQASALLGAYALDILSPGERTAVDAHLQTSAELRTELAAHRRALARLNDAEPTRDPPAALKAQLMAQVAATAKKPVLPVTPKRRFGFGDWLRGGLALPRFAVAALSLVVVVALGGLGTQGVRLTGEQLAYRQAMALLTDAEASRIDLRGRPAAPAATGTLKFRPEGQVAVLEANNLPVLEPNRAYQLWLVCPDETRDTGAIFQVVQPDGTTTIVVRSPKPLGQYIRFGISIEPAGGSPGPTGPGALSSRA